MSIRAYDKSATDAAIARALLSHLPIIGEGLPMDSETVLPLVTDGNGNTWNWRAMAWFSRAYPVRWKAGDHVGIPTGPWPGVGHATIQASTSNGATPWVSDQTVDAAPQYDFDDNSTGDKPAPSDGSGVIFLIQTTTGYPHTPDVLPALPNLNILDYLGDLELLSDTPVPYALDDGDGADGGIWINWWTRDLYTRADGSWSFRGQLALVQNQLSLSSTSASAPIFEGFGGPGSGSSPTDASLIRVFADGRYSDGPQFEVRPSGAVLFMGSEPTDDELSPGQLAIWSEMSDIENVAVLQAKAKTPDGTILRGSINTNGF